MSAGEVVLVLALGSDARRADPGAYLLLLARQGRLSVRQTGRQVDLVPGQVLLLDGSRPFHTRRSAPSEKPDAAGTIVLRLARDLVPLAAHEVEPFLAVPLDARGGLGGVLVRWLTGLVEECGHEFVAVRAGHDGAICLRSPADGGTRTLSAGGGRALAAATATLVAALLAQHVAEHGPWGDSGLYGKIRHFLREHLADHGLSPHGVAAAHHISVRHLHKIFRAHGTTVGSYIRQCRLARCRVDLADPALRTLTVQAVAVRWGFTDAAHFSRLFRATYGLPPREYRRIALGDAASTGGAAGARIDKSPARTDKTGCP